MGINAQEQLLLLNGKVFTGNAIDTTGLKVVFERINSSNKNKMMSYYRDEVFSIQYTNDEKVFFFPSEFYDEDYTIENMRMVVYGKRDARYHFKTKWVLPTGAAVGFLSAYFSKGSVFTLFVPLLYTGIVQIPVVKIQKESISSVDFIGNEFYKEGYNRLARSKRTKHALVSSICGVLAGLLTYELTTN
jgi:hypothetical protein